MIVNCGKTSRSQSDHHLNVHNILNSSSVYLIVHKNSLFMKLLFYIRMQCKMRILTSSFFACERYIFLPAYNNGFYSRKPNTFLHIQHYNLVSLSVVITFITKSSNISICKAKQVIMFF